jgi:nicotinamide-nucleotide amidase
VITGSELVRGERTDLNGPFLARQLLSLGLEPARILIVGDREEELEEALRLGVGADLMVTSGGLGPTHDDRTVELVARVAGRELELRTDLHEEIGGISRAFAERMRRPYADFEEGVRKQAMLPAGAISIGLAGTAPGSVLDLGETVVVVLPGPPAELQRLWPGALETEPVRRVLGRAQPPGRRLLRFYGASESAIARALREAGGEPDGVETTICARDFEIHVDLVVQPGFESAAEALEAALVAPVEQYLFARDERPVEEIVFDLARAGGLTVGTAESCTGGMVAARLTRVPGASEVFRGSVVAYANDVKESELGVPAETLREHGAVSGETALAMAAGARARLGVDVAVSVTGIAGPDGGTDEKPVGLVYLAVAGPGGVQEHEFNIPGDRSTVRARATVMALHLLRRHLTPHG